MTSAEDFIHTTHRGRWEGVLAFAREGLPTLARALSLVMFRPPDAYYIGALTCIRDYAPTPLLRREGWPGMLVHLIRMHFIYSTTGLNPVL